MERFTTSDGVAIAYEFDASAPPGLPPVVLLHGFAVSGQLNFGGPGLIDGLADADRRTIVVDARGHGDSDKPTDPAVFGEARMAQDVRELVDHLGLDAFDLIGYSMGAVVALLIAADDPRVRRMAVGGVGSGIIETGGVDSREMPKHMIVQAMLAPDADAVEYPLGAAWRAFAEAVDADLS
ncbi:MAG: alpha/beta fold hydrolase, partial [Solirubrobacteraceae bacterium]|nr:alpha/beta fold hydrolase [Solirubrobacteraceae bacterium]